MNIEGESEEKRTKRSCDRNPRLTEVPQVRAARGGSWAFSQLNQTQRGAGDDRPSMTNPKGCDHCVAFCHVYVSSCVFIFKKTLLGAPLNDPPRPAYPLPRISSPLREACGEACPHAPTGWQWGRRLRGEDSRSVFYLHCGSHSGPVRERPASYSFPPHSASGLILSFSHLSAAT